MNIALSNIVTNVSPAIVRSSNKKPLSTAYVECEYGNIIYNYVDPSYNLKYQNFEIDIDYSYNELERGYILKSALYRNDEIIAFKSDLAFSLNDGLIRICETIINENKGKM